MEPKGKDEMLPRFCRDCGEMTDCPHHDAHCPNKWPVDPETAGTRAFAAAVGMVTGGGQ